MRKHTDNGLHADFNLGGDKNRHGGVGDFRNIIVSNCVISRSNRGLSIQIRDGGNVENVKYSDIIIGTRRFCPDWWGTAEPIVITAFDRDENTRQAISKTYLTAT